MSQVYEVAEPSGIYQIRCTSTGRIYVGSSVDIQMRWKAHRYNLSRRRHCNPYLQRAWSRHGESRFEFVILELVDANLLRSSELSWIDRLRATDRRRGFNVNRQATAGNRPRGRSWIGFRNPEGKPVKIVNLSAFCRLNQLDRTSMGLLASGKGRVKSHKGWTHQNSVRVREYIKVHRGYIDPEGKPFRPIRNLAAFCRERGLDDTHRVAVAAGRIVSHRGWTHVGGRVKSTPITHWGFVAPDGTPTPIKNLAAFCRANGLCKVHMHEVKARRRPSHKGWTWRKPNI